MATKAIDLDKMSAEELYELSKEATLKAEALQSKIYDTTMTTLNDKLATIHKTKKDAVHTLFSLMSKAERAETLDELNKKKPAGSESQGETPDEKFGKKEPESADSTGAMPVRGATYKHESWDAPYTFTGKRVPGDVRKTAKETTWAELLVK